MRYDSRNDAQTLRGKAVGPAALMLRQSLLPFVPDRGTLSGGHVPFRRATRPLAGFGASSTVADAAQGAGVGAKVGSYAGPIGTAIGTVVGAIGGAIFAAFNRQDPENANFNQAQAIADSQGPAAVLNIANKYLVLAGLFDLTPSQIKGNIPMYKKYGRMGEAAFVKDMINRVYTAAQNGQITVDDTAQSVYARIVQPWMDSWGFGAMNDHNGTMLQYILMGMLAEYFAGLQTRWASVGGQNVFSSLPPFSLPTPPAPLPPAATAPPASQQTVQYKPPVAAAPDNTPPELKGYLGGAVPTNGTAIHYAKYPGGFMAIPAGGTYAGYAPNGGWLVNYPTGQYFIDSTGTLQIYPPVSTAMQGSSASTATQTQPDAVPSQTSATGASTPQVIYTSGGGGYIAPTTTAPVPEVQSAATQSFPTWVAVGGVALLAVVMMNRRTSRRG